ncbi:polysaccharide pyruvyl transferase CsaB [Paenibacillus filicis]|uniref:Polysaccharide pyruvyl transferase CsaB n=1 Tax=Paenibacillus gyeongsangnamensis TaxID=3388067 RepID=A0ABT4QD90_9BACL|nr:polysaccharide pyruvyl transferase CsaB [Paenibacillus filicis]MCZ8514854.1 polysaccharide pyruvyl transferase CsaB [Paenibacillus filicis]
MGTPVKRIVLSGYYGFRNSGDEAVLQSILLALQEQGERQGVQFVPVVLSVNPAETREVYGVESVHRMRPQEVWKALKKADGLISGGGSLLQDETGWKTIPYYLAVIRLAQWLGKPTFIYSQGIGPVHRISFFGWIRSVFRRCQLITVRDPESAALLERMGVAKAAIQVVPDPVMGMPLKGKPTHSNNAATDAVIGVSVRFWNEDRSDLNAVAEALHQLLETTEATIRFLPFHLPSDEQASLYVMERLREIYKHRLSITSDITHPQDMLKEVASCRLLIGMRLHSLIYGANQLVPVAGISYDPKIDQFLKRLDMNAVMNTKQPAASELVREAGRLLTGYEQWKLDKQPAIERLKNEAQRPAEQIASFYTKGRGMR